MKKILIIISILIVITLTGCTNKELGSKSKYDIKITSVTMKVKESTLTKSQATFIITNNTEIEFSYGEPYHLEKKIDGEWYELKPIADLNFIMPAYSLKGNESKEKNYNWEYGYGQLKKGTYRLVTEIFNEKENLYIAGEFTIK